jgi:hypothetical protein
MSAPCAKQTAGDRRMATRYAPHIHDLIVSRDVAIMGLAWALTVVSSREDSDRHNRIRDAFAIR